MTRKSSPFKRHTQLRHQSWILCSPLLCFALSALLLLAAPAIASTLAQSPITTPLSETTSLPELNLNIPDFFNPSGSSEIRTGIVRLDGRRLFAVAVPEVSDDGGEQEQNPITIELRVNSVETQLRRIVNSNFDVDTLEVYPGIDEQNRYRLYASYGPEESRTTDYLMTVTSLDAQIHGASVDDWAEELSQRIETALIQAEQERQPTFLRRQAAIASAILMGMIVISLGLSLLQRYLHRRYLFLAAQREVVDQQMTAAVDSTNPTEMSTSLLERQMKTQQRHHVNEIQRRILQVVQVSVWASGILITLGLFPYTRWLQPFTINALKVPVYILGIVFLTYIAIRLSGVFVDRVFIVLQDSSSLANAESSQRLALRFSTFSRVVKSIVGAVLISLGVITSLAVVGIEVGPLLAGAGIIGIGISFASQSLIKDIINGFLILFEDQYGVGDVIVVGEVAGLVENMNLRITQLRNEEGRLITIPNGEIKIVQNLSKEWSRVDLTIEVAHSANIDEALALIKQVAEDMSRDRAWQHLILEAPLLLGIDKLDHIGALVRLWIKTQPLKQWDVAREYRRRLKLAFDDAEIPIGIPQQALAFKSDLNLTGEITSMPRRHRRNGFTSNSDSDDSD